MLKVGLTGGIACGKTVVRNGLEERGIPTLDADAVVHRLLGAGTDVGREIGETFGGRVIAPDKSVDREALGALVFADEEARRKLNRIVHPRVWREIERFFAERANAKDRVAVVDAALMIETGSFRRYDRVVVVHCRPEQQLERLMSRDGLSREDAERRIRAQMPIEEKRGFADFLVDTSGTIEETLARTDDLARELSRAA
ncbi:MAG: dephospho-CoA kinase [Vicinamibacteria bacterium]